MPKSLHHCCRIYCSLDAEITALLIAENTALLDAVNNSWILDTDICNYAGACRFYVGLAKEIRVLDSPEFEEYVKTYIQENLMK